MQEAAPTGSSRKLKFLCFNEIRDAVAKKKGEDEDSDVEERFRATGHQKFELLAVDLPAAFFFIDVVEC